MPVHFRPGDLVQTAFGKGTVRDVRNNDRLLVDVRGRGIVFARAEISAVDERNRRGPARSAPPGDRAGDRRSWRSDAHVPPEIDLHGLTVELALARAEAALNDALLGDLPELRFIHGRSGGRIRDALHRWLAGIASIQAFRLDPRNPGVTVVTL
jgi:DNA mismatch repair protein MutS2